MATEAYEFECTYRSSLLNGREVTMYYKSVQEMLNSLRYGGQSESAIVSIVRQPDNSAERLESEIRKTAKQEAA